MYNMDNIYSSIKDSMMEIWVKFHGPIVELLQNSTRMWGSEPSGTSDSRSQNPNAS